MTIAARAALVLALGLFGTQVGTGCSTSQVKDAPDAKPAFECRSDPVLFCNPAPPGTLGCTGALDSADAFLQKLPADKAYAEGCVANFVKRDPRVEEVCGLAAVCTCVRVEDAVDAAIPPTDAAQADSAVPDAGDPDASADASTDADPDAGTADAAPPPPAPVDAAPPVQDAAPGPTKPVRLVWSCR